VNSITTCFQPAITATPTRRSTPTPACQSLPLLRVASILCRTAWTVGSLPFTRSPMVDLHLWARAVLRSLGLRIEIRGEPQDASPLWVCNHLSWLDPLVLLSLRPMGALAKSEVAGYPIVGRASRKLGLAFVDRQDPVSRAAAVVRLVTELRKGKPMLLFPEGTTTDGHGLAPLQEGGLRAAFRCGAAVQTFRLSSEDPGYPWLGEETLLPHLMNLARASATRLRLETGSVLEPQAFSNEGAWLEAIRQQLTPLA